MTPQERLRKHQRALEKTQRELDRERVKLENQEKKLVQDIRKSAKNGQMGACKIQAKDLVRTRRYAVKLAHIFGTVEASGRAPWHLTADDCVTASDISINSIPCAHSSKPFPFESKQSDQTNR